MAEALVKDCTEHLPKIEAAKEACEAAVASADTDESILQKTQVLTKAILDYKGSAKHVKKYTTKPKPKPKAKAAAVSEPNTAPPA